MKTDVLDPGYGILAAEMDVGFYLRRNGDVDAAQVDPVSHYLSFGWKEGRDPAAWFSTENYLRDNEDVRTSGMNPLLHYSLYGRKEGRKVCLAEEPLTRPAPLAMTHAFDVGSGSNAAVKLKELEETARSIVEFIRPEIDVDFYREQLSANGGAAESLDFSLHYAMYGVQEGLNPVDWFSTRKYLAANRDVEDAGVNPFFHYIVAGREEGRPLSPPLDVNSEDDYELDVVRSEFDFEFYLGAYPDVAAGDLDPLQHFMKTGWREHRNPNPFFSVEDYLGNYQDIRDAGVNPFFHFIVSGRAEGRIGKPDLGFRYEVIRHSSPFAARVAEWRNWPVQAPPTDAVASSALTLRLSQLDRSGGEAVYLSISHDDFTTNTGGVQLVLMREAEGVALLGFDHIHIYPAKPLLMVEGEDRPLHWGLLFNGENLGIFSVEVATAALAKAVGTGARREFAVHSFLGHSPDRVAGAIEAIGAKSGYFWIHDYASICTSYTLMRNDVEFCGAPPPESSACAICVYGASRVAQTAAHSAFAERFELTVVAPSKAALDIWTRATPMKAKTSKVLRHCSLSGISALGGMGGLTRPNTGKPLRIGFIGTALVQKGWPEFRELALKFGRNGQYEFHHFARYSQAGLGIKHTPVSVSSTHLDAMIEAVAAAEIDVAMIWSLWPETFCIAAFEAAAAGAAVFAPRKSGNVALSIEKGELFGVVFDDEAALETLFETGKINEWARSSREDRSYHLSYSRMTADLIESSAR